MQVLELIHTGNWQLLAFVMKNTTCVQGINFGTSKLYGLTIYLSTVHTIFWLNDIFASKFVDNSMTAYINVFIMFTLLSTYVSIKCQNNDNTLH